MTYSRMICFTTVTHLINHKVVEVWAAMHKIYQMYMLRGFHIVEIAGNGEFAVDQVACLPTNPLLNLAAASEHVGLIECNIRFLKEKTLNEEIFDKSSDRISQLVNKIWLCRYPRCRYLIYDNGLEFKLHFETFCNSYSIKRKPTTSRPSTRKPIS